MRLVMAPVYIHATAHCQLGELYSNWALQMALISCHTSTLHLHIWCNMKIDWTATAIITKMLDWSQLSKIPQECVFASTASTEGVVQRWHKMGCEKYQSPFGVSSTQDCKQRRVEDSPLGQLAPTTRALCPELLLDQLRSSPGLERVKIGVNRCRRVNRRAQLHELVAELSTGRPGY